jgi:hypothetical protein
MCQTDDELMMGLTSRFQGCHPRYVESVSATTVRGEAHVAKVYFGETRPSNLCVMASLWVPFHALDWPKMDADCPIAFVAM